MPPIQLLSAIGSAMIFTGVWVFVALAGALAVGMPMLHWDQAIMDALRTWVTPQMLQLFAALTHLADPRTLTVCVCLAHWCCWCADSSPWRWPGCWQLQAMAC